MSACGSTRNVPGNCCNRRRRPTAPRSRPAADRPRSRWLCRWSGQPPTLVQLEGHGRRGAVRRYRPDPGSVGWFTSAYPLRPDPGAEPGRADQGDQGTAPRGADTKPSATACCATSPDLAVRQGDGRAAHGADHLPTTSDSSDQSFADALFQPLDQPTGPIHDEQAPLLQRAERRWPGLRRRAGAALDLQPRALRRADGERAGAGLSRRTAVR
ncbi:hypothetical protein ACPA9J_19005 [Pseudomonas aeruginosa]